MKKGVLMTYYCPECGGEMIYDTVTRNYTCKSCGLSVPFHEYAELKQNLEPKVEDDMEKRKKRRKEYLDWWFSKKTE